MPAYYNPNGLDGLPVLVPEADYRLVRASLVTREGPRRALRVTSRVPHLSRQIAVTYGIDVQRITWELVLEATSMEGLLSWEQDVETYLRRGGAYRLVHELAEGDPASTGPAWEEAVLESYDRADDGLHRMPGGTVVRSGRIHFEVLG